MVQHDWSVGS